MSRSIEYIADALRQARNAGKMSQRALAAKAGVTQAQISKIERGEVNLATGTLIQIARALELELMLIPRQRVPAVNLVRNEQAHASPRPAYSLEEDRDEEEERHG